MMKCYALFSFFLIPILASCVERQVYVVYFGEHGYGEKALHEIEESHHFHLLSVKKTDEEARSSLLYSYKHSFNGFAAVLTPDEASKLAGRDGVVSVFKSIPRKYSLQTTRSWEFVGVAKPTKSRNSNKEEDILLKSKYGRDAIVGIVDTGIWPESKSFSDKGMGPIPKRWKGICQSGDAFNSSHCNKKIIGARYYIKGYEHYYGPLNRTLDYLSPRDKDGHGTHTASTVGGRRVHNVSVQGGFGRGTASGGAPLARLAIYKVCWPVPEESSSNEGTCFDEDMLAAMDDAISDGVDILSISIGTSEPIPFSKDAIALGALHAVKKNIVVASSAGNSGPAPASLSNPAPWIITVGASSLDREFIASVKLGNGHKIEGQTITPTRMEKKLYPLVRASQVANPDVPEDLIDQCLPGSLAPEKAKGKIVMCIRGNGTRVGKGAEVIRAGGIGYILGNSRANGEELSVDSHLLPATSVGYKGALKILHYINSTKTPVAYISRARTKLHGVRAPYMAAFSSRGPNVIYPDIIKPDITAPGLNILAAWSEGTSPTNLVIDHRVVKYSVLSGTSMSCPHIGGVAALLKGIHPSWSSAAIRSALMTTAELINRRGEPITDASGVEADSFQFGSGHFRPTKAADPGLVYDATYQNYLLFLCSNGIKSADPSLKCPESPPPANNLNYPSLAIPKLKGTVIVKRTVTNVGSSKSVYFASVKSPLGISVEISPSMLYFNHVGQKKSFTITVTAINIGKIAQDKYLFGWYTWRDSHGIYNVQSPIAVALA